MFCAPFGDKIPETISFSEFWKLRRTVEIFLWASRKFVEYLNDFVVVSRFLRTPDVLKVWHFFWRAEKFTEIFERTWKFRKLFGLMESAFICVEKFTVLS